MTRKMLRIRPEEYINSGIETGQNDEGPGYGSLVTVRISHVLWGFATSFISGVLIGGILAMFIVTQIAGRN